MKRWLLFSSIYLKEHLDWKVIILIALPSFLPLPALLISFFLGWPFVLLALLLLLIKAVWMLAYRHLILTARPYPDEVFYEVLNDLVLPWLFLYGANEQSLTEINDKHLLGKGREFFTEKLMILHMKLSTYHTDCIFRM